MLFSEIVGQDLLKEKLIQTVRESRISHARMFLGPEGAGSLPLAIAYAQYVNCTNRGENDACGVCSSCVKFRKLVHPDLHFVFPVVKPSSGAAVSDIFIKEWRAAIINNPYITYNQWLEVMGAENKQGGIFVDESKEILNKLSFKTYEADYKVMIIWLAEKMNQQTANKLLKILEEPPEKTLFLLIAESADLILPTILSRTQLTRVPKIDSPTLAAYLIATGQCSSEQQAANIAHTSNGNMAQAHAAIRASDEDNYYLDMFIRMMRTCWSVWGKKQAMLDLMVWCDEITNLNREGQKSYLLYCLRMVRENFIMNRQQPELAFMTDAEYDFSRKFNSFIHPDNVFFLTEELNKAHYHIEANGNKNIVFLDMACKIVVLLKH